MSKRQRESSDPGIPTPDTPGSDHMNGRTGDDILTEFTQAPSRQDQARKRQRIELRNSSDSEDDAVSNSSNQATSGIIEKIQLSNFMCHDYFEVTLGPQINFIIGQNGSGKSAVLTAISIGLGAKATDTSRGASLKAFIKNGCSSSRVTITFKNEGRGAYKPDVFGKKIIVQRHLKLEGSSKYSISNELGKQVTDKKQDLDALLAAFGITVNNPMAILTQDAAKSFIATSSDEEKYKFFMAGTKADETIKNYHGTQEQLVKVKENLVRLTEDMRAIKKADLEAKSLFDRYEGQEELIKMKELYQAKHLWIQVQVRENKIKKSTNGIKNFEEEIESARQHILQRESAIKEKQNEKDAYVEKINELENLKLADHEKMTAFYDLIKKDTTVLKDQTDEAKTMTRELKEDEAKAKRIKAQIAKEQETVDAVNGGSLEQLAQEKTALQKDIEDLNDNLGRLQEKRYRIAEDASEEDRALKEDIQVESQTRNKLQEQIKAFSNSSNNRLAAYGKQIYSVLQSIERDAGFHQKPIGPLGRYINLRANEEKWSGLLEANLSKSLTSFIVHDQHDFQRLSSLFRRMNYRTTIIVRKHETFNYDSDSASSSLKRVMDVLSIDDPFIRCMLVDMNQINKVVLEDDREKAERLLRTRVSNVNTVLVPYDNRSGNMLKVNRFGGLQIDVIRYNNDAEKINSESSSEEKVEKYQRNLVAISRRLDILKDKQRNLSSDVRAKEAQLDRDIRDIKKKISQNERQINSINNKLDDTQSSSRLEALEEEQVRLEREMKLREVALEQFERSLHKLQTALNEKRAQYSRDLSDFKAKYRNIDQNNDGLNQLQTDIDNASKDISHFERSISKREQFIQKLQTYIEEESSVVKELCEAAEGCGTRSFADLREDDTLESIESDKSRIEAEVEEFEKNIGMSREEVTKNYEKARSNFITAKMKIAEVATLKEALQKSLDDRLMSFEKMRLDICNKVNDSFQKALMLRQFTGKILFDFERGKLTMMVSTKRNEKLRNIESFSGGEKSFSQISLLLSIWDFMNSKIRGLDEFDVFMDQVNRTLSLRLILQKIKNSPSQTIFITPLDIAGVDGINSSNVHIHRIAHH